MAKRSHSPTRKVYSSSVPQKPPLSVSDNYEAEIDQTIAPNSPHSPSLAQLHLSMGTTDYTESEDNQDFYATVRVPNRESLAINLVPSDLVYKLEEYRSDGSRLAAFFWAIIGAILGIIINWITSDPLTITSYSLMMTGILVLFDVLVYFFMNDFSKRAKTKMDEIKNFRYSSHKNTIDNEV